MTNITLISLIFAVYGLGAGFVLWSAYHPGPDGETLRAGFRPGYFILPLAVFLLSVAITAWFYPKLPAELAFSFRLDASTMTHFTRGLAPVLMLLPQLVLALPLAVITWGITRMDLTSKDKTNLRTMLERTLLLIGNMVALPQIIICFALADIFSYNAYGRHLMPLWLFGAIILVTGVFFLSSLFYGAMRHRPPPDSDGLKN
ncbi:MAG: hypothetical protein Q7J06_02100 [Bacteroidales bacterium]|nr:hypothetical protein [Bacteroidales bacterium]